MENTLFIIGFSLFFLLLFFWGFRRLPNERWQVMACVPIEKTESGVWKGLNLTYYGFFNALACGVSIALLFMLLGSAGIPFAGIAAITVIVLALCIPASSIIARLVEKRPFTFSIGGASFVGILITPWIIIFTGRIVDNVMGTGFTIPLYPTLAAVSIAYAVGEGTGRLACISYGCCYGMPISESGPFLRRIFNRYHFVFRGRTKKISYASNLEGVKVVPIQAITSTIHIVVALIGIVLYFNEFFFISFLIPFISTQLWRVLSEFLRADYRGHGSISLYQIMALVSLFYISTLVLFLPPAEPLHVDILKGIRSLWNPSVIITLEAIVITIFIYTGRSDMTASSVTLHMNSERA